MAGLESPIDELEPLFPGEIAPPGEARAVRVIVEGLEARVRAATGTGPAHRDAHPKAHGCVRAEFRVLGDLPQALRVGVFAAPRAYQAWIRFSNAAETPGPDSAGDARGMAIKLMDVADSPSTTQDFAMINHPVFFVRNAIDYVDFQKAANPFRFFFPSFNPFRFRLHELMVALAITGHRMLNPLNARYWSTTPVRLGDVACKYSAQPAGAPSPFTDTGAPDYLHDNLALHLAQGAASFDFMVQPRPSTAGMPIEDPTVAWSEADAPFVTVARITIPPQAFDSAEQHAFCENLSFTPWHCVEAHRPLGGINRVRRVVYEHISRLRHDLNGVPRSEPTGLQP